MVIVKVKRRKKYYYYVTHPRLEPTAPLLGGQGCCHCIRESKGTVTTQGFTARIYKRRLSKHGSF
jgi:hypothetical protein